MVLAPKFLVDVAQALDFSFLVPAIGLLTVFSVVFSQEHLLFLLLQFLLFFVLQPLFCLQLLVTFSLGFERHGGCGTITRLCSGSRPVRLSTVQSHRATEPANSSSSHDLVLHLSDEVLDVFLSLLV